MRDSAKAIALYTTIARDTVKQYNVGEDPSGFVAQILKEIAVDNTVASSLAFEHFAHVFAGPEPGEHGVRQADELRGRAEADAGSDGLPRLDPQHAGAQGRLLT
jgi:hypothetical protein